MIIMVMYQMFLKEESIFNVFNIKKQEIRRYNLL